MPSRRRSWHQILSPFISHSSVSSMAMVRFQAMGCRLPLKLRFWITMVQYAPRFRVR